jgi:pimeloyl-ACP methyl ester carboxylesterase
MKTMTLADGRELAYETYGDPSGTPVIFCHGFGDSRLIRNPDDDLTASLGVHVAVALWNWGFALEDVHQPLDVFYGDADDIISPEMPAHVAERLPAATPHDWPGAGHYGFIDRARWIEFWSPLGR